MTPSNKPSEIPGWPILNANKGPNGPSICIVAASPVVIVVLVAFLAASTKRLWLGASSLRKKSIGDTGLFAPDRYDGGLSHTKWMFGVTSLENDSNWKSLIQTNPVQRQTLLLYQAWVHLNAMDFAGVVTICESVLPFVEDPGRGPWRRFALIFAGTAETALGNYKSAHKYLSTALNEMDRQTLIFDWYFRMLLGSAMTELWLTKRDLTAARTEAERFLSAALATAERTWQALAWEANARVAVALLDRDRARDCIANAVSTMEGFEVPLAQWRVHATAAELFKSMQNSGQADQHRALNRATILKLAESLPAEEPLRKIFLSALLVRKVLGNDEISNGASSRSATRRLKRSDK